MLTFISLLVAAAWGYLALAHGNFWTPLLPRGAVARTQMPSVDIVVPARNEAEMLPRTLPFLLTQKYTGAWHIILVDDHSTDGTAEIARKIAADAGKSEHLTVISAPDLPKGWSGKVWAMNTGVAHSKADYILFTDADIRHPNNSVEKLVATAEFGKIDLVSRMVKLNCRSSAEKILVPAFVFFFAMLYPFRLVNSPASRVAGAAGGVMLARRSILDRIGGLDAISSALIDDCSLARIFKEAGAKIELTFALDTESLRSYPRVDDIWKMVARTAYTQLKFSPYLLAATALGLFLMFLLPPLLFLFPPTLLALCASFVSYVAMTGMYAPTVDLYHLRWTWALTLPAAALVYLAATLDSARLYYQKKGGQWKGRAQA